ncbi:MAG: DUF1801 domain-containing protein [Verrucomicrobiota bacterium]
MKPEKARPKNIDEYIATLPPKVQTIMGKIRQIIRKVAPDAQEVISYQMPAFKRHGILLYFAAWKSHIGLYPPISGDPELEKAIAPFAGEKGNLQFPLDAPIPYNLIQSIAQLRLKQDMAKAAARRKKTV